MCQGTAVTMIFEAIKITIGRVSIYFPAGSILQPFYSFRDTSCTFDDFGSNSWLFIESFIEI